MATLFEPIRPVPPMTTIFMVSLPCRRLEVAPGAKFQRWDSVFNSGHQNRKVRQAKLTDGAAMCAAEIPSGQGSVGGRLGPPRTSATRLLCPSYADISGST